MGSITTHRPKGITNDEFFKENVVGPDREIIASSTVRGAYYAAVSEPKTGEVFALVIKITRMPRSYMNFNWKSMTETCGPYYYDAPAKVLDALTETDNEEAIEWRARCRATIERRKAAPKVTKGTRVTFARTFEFQDGGEGQTFELIERSTFRRADGKRVRIPSWRTRYTWSVAA